MDNRYRNYSKGKSFKFSKWNALDTYNNDEFIQDWVVYEGKLYVCIKTNTNVIPLGSKEWEFVNNVGKDGVTPLFQIINDFWEISYDNGKTWGVLSRATGENGKDGINGLPGKDGIDGVDGKDGINGTDGVDGITPLLKIENDFWYVSYNNGVNWECLSKSVGEDGINGNTPIIKVENDFWWVSYNYGESWEELMPVEHPGETNTESVEVKHNIPVVDGPLSKALNDIGITEIEEGTSLHNLLLALFCKENWPENIKSVLGTFVSVSGINNSSITVTPDALVEPGTKLIFSAKQGSVKGYSTTKSSVTGLQYGYSTSNNNIKEGDTSEFYKSWSVSPVSSEYNIILSGGVSDSSKSGNSPQTISDYEIISKIGSNTCSVKSSGTSIYEGSIEEIPIYYGVSNLGHTSDKYKSTKLESITKTVTSSGNISNSKTVTCAWPCYHNKSGSILLDTASTKILQNTSSFTIESIPSEEASGKSFIFEYPANRTVSMMVKPVISDYYYYTNISGGSIIESINTSGTKIPSNLTIRLNGIPAEDNVHFKLQFPSQATLKTITKLNTNSGNWETLNPNVYSISSGFDKNGNSYSQFEIIGAFVGSSSYEFIFNSPSYNSIVDYTTSEIQKTINGIEYDYVRLMTNGTSGIVSRKITLSKSTIV